MPKAFQITDAKIQDYIDGRLSPRERALFAAQLESSPEKAELVYALQRQNDILKAAGAEILDEPIPERLRAVLDTSNKTTNGSGAGRKSQIKSPMRSIGYGTSLARGIAASFMALVVGGVLGWYGRDLSEPEINPEDLVLSSGLDAYRLYGADKDFPVEFTSDRLNDLTGWLNRTFKVPIKPPALDDRGYKLIGGRVLPYSSGNYGFFLFENDKSHRVAVICWPRGQEIKRRRPYSPGKEYVSRYWNKDKFGFAVYAQSSNLDFDKIADSVVSFYDSLFEGK